MYDSTVSETEASSTGQQNHGEKNVHTHTDIVDRVPGRGVA